MPTVSLRQIYRCEVVDENAREVGFVDDVLFHPTEPRAVGFSVKPHRVGGIVPLPMRFVLFEATHIDEEGRVCVNVDSSLTEKKAVKAARTAWGEKAEKVLCCTWDETVIYYGQLVFTEDGALLGRISDARFDWADGSMNVIQVTDGAVSDLSLGKRAIPGDMVQGYRALHEGVLVDRAAASIAHDGGAARGVGEAAAAAQEVGKKAVATASDVGKKAATAAVRGAAKASVQVEEAARKAAQSEAGKKATAAAQEAGKKARGWAKNFMKEFREGMRDDEGAATRTVFVLASLLACVALIAGLLVGCSHDISVTYRTQKHEVAQDTGVATFVSQVDTSAVSGNLVDVTGQLLATSKGEEPRYFVNGKKVPANTVLQNGDEVTADPGKNLVEKITYKKEEGHIGFKRSGSGPVVRVTKRGSNPYTTVAVGQQSGKKVAATGTHAKTSKGSAPEVSYVGYHNAADKVAVLTFDDGPNPDYTKKIVNVLNANGVKATFFMVGTEVKKYPEIAQYVADSGNQVALHSATHSRLAGERPSRVRHEMRKGKAEIKKATGVDVTWMRPPYGSVDGTVYDAMAQYNLKIGLWSIDTKDWSRPGTNHIVSVAKKYRFPGAILLMHDGGGNRAQTLHALPRIIASYKRAGYRFVTLEEYDKLIGAQ